MFGNYSIISQKIKEYEEFKEITLSDSQKEELKEAIMEDYSESDISLMELMDVIEIVDSSFDWWDE